MSFIKSKLQTAINNNMKNTFKTLLFISLLCGVSGADEIKSVSVMEGDSVTLQTEEKILTYNQIMWRFGVALIAEITDGGKIRLYEDVADGRFRGRLKLDQQTGSLTITNTRTIHSGDYKIQIETNAGRIEKRFTLTVYESPSVIDPDTTEVKSVMEGESVSLNTDINPHGDELIVWWFGCILIAKVDKENNKISFSPDERFKDRIHLDQNGSLIINNSRTADTGEYKLKISSSNRDTKHKRFILTLSEPPMSAGAIAGIIVAVLLIVAAAAAVAVIYHLRWISELKRLLDKVRRVFVMKEKSVRLITDDAHIKTDEVNVYYGDTLIAEIRRGTITRVTDEFSGRLELNHQTGSLTINNSRRSDSGLYELKISISTDEITFKRIIVTVSGDEWIRKMVKKGDSVALSSDVSELQKDAEVVWKFKNTVIAEKKQQDKTISLRQDAHEDFRGKLNVNQQTGSLTITDITMDQGGDYELNITSSRETVHQRFNVCFHDEVIRKMVKEGYTVDLSSDVTELQEDAQVVWKFADTVIAEKKQKDKTISLRQDAHEEDFGGKLNVNQQTGSLIITDITIEQGGDYELKITSSRETVHKIFNVCFHGEYIITPLTEGDSDTSGSVSPPLSHGKARPSRAVAIDKVNESVSLMMK